MEDTLSITVDLSGADVCLGALRLEAHRGALRSNTMSVLMMPCAASAAEVCQLEGADGTSQLECQFTLALVWCQAQKCVYIPLF